MITKLSPSQFQICNWNNVQHQVNGYDCGDHVITYAIDLAFDRDPASLSYDQQEMRKHLLQYLQGGLRFDDDSVGGDKKHHVTSGVQAEICPYKAWKQLLVSTRFSIKNFCQT